MTISYLVLHTVTMCTQFVKRTLYSWRRTCLVESSYPGPVSPGPRLLAPLAVGLRGVDTVVLGGPEAQQHAELLPRPHHLLAGQDGLHDGECSLPQPPASLPSLSHLDSDSDKILSTSSYLRLTVCPGPVLLRLQPGEDVLLGVVDVEPGIDQADVVTTSHLTISHSENGITQALINIFLTLLHSLQYLTSNHFPPFERFLVFVNHISS